MDDDTTFAGVGALFPNSVDHNKTPVVKRYQQEEWVPWLLPRSLALYFGLMVGKSAYHSGNVAIVMLYLVTTAICVEMAIAIKTALAKLLYGFVYAPSILRHAEIALIMTRHSVINAIAFAANESIVRMFDGSDEITKYASFMIIIIIVTEVLDVLGFRAE